MNYPVAELRGIKPYKQASLNELNELLFDLFHYKRRRRNMKKYECVVCGYIYDPEAGDPTQDIAAGTAFDDLPDSWVCPECGVGKDDFEPAE